MRIAYLECFAGISGDMFLGALLDAGLDPAVLHDATAALDLGATLRVTKVDRAGITSTKVDVLEGGMLAEDALHHHAHAAPGQPVAAPHEHGGEELDEQRSADPLSHAPETQHLHKGGHHHHPTDVVEQPHTQVESVGETGQEEHPHHHGRSLPVIRGLIREADLPDPVRSFAVRTFELLGASEARIHNVPVEQIHFHEVGAVDAIVDIVAASAGIHALNAQALAETGEPLRWICSALNVGGGTVHCAHGDFPVPAPATADLLRGFPTYSAHVQKELVTPTGAALLRALTPAFGAQPSMIVAEIGYGAGTRNPEGFPNVLRISIGEASQPAPEPPSAFAATASSIVPRAAKTDSQSCLGQPQANVERVTLLEVALDDLSPQILAYVTEQALALGALDVMTASVNMKKGRLGTLLTVLTTAEKSPAMERLLLRETSTLGIRIREERRICLSRRHVSVVTEFGEIRIKVGEFDGEELNAAPEFEDCRAAAATHGVAVKRVLQAAVAAYHASTHP